MEALNDIFTIEPNIISLPPQAPPDIPRIIFQNENVGQLTIAFTRTDLTMKWIGGS
jgi:hypothetical protein